MQSLGQLLSLSLSAQRTESLTLCAPPVPVDSQYSANVMSSRSLAGSLPVSHIVFGQILHSNLRYFTLFLIVTKIHALV